MKKFIYSLVMLFICRVAVSQQKLNDGVYLVDKLAASSNYTAAINRALITYNPLFIEESPDEYAPLLICTDDFVPFEFSLLPILQRKNNGENLLFLRLTGNASEKLKAFTEKNRKRYVVVVVSGQALIVEKIKETITSGLVQIVCYTDTVYQQLYMQLKNNVKE